MMLLKWWKRAQLSRRVFAMLSLLLMVFCILILLGPGFPDVARGAWPGLSTSARGHVESGLEKAFQHVLKLANSSLVVDKRNDTFAILSRIMAFCSVPRAVPSEAVPMQQELTLDSVSGLKIFVRKENGSLIANNIRSEQVDLRKGKIIVHVMMGVIMDVEFELSFLPDL